MSIRLQLLQTNSSDKANRFEEQILRNRELLPELMACFFSDEVIVAQRAAFVVGHIGRKEPELFVPWLAEIVDAVEKPVHQAIRRNGVRYFAELDGDLIPAILEQRMVALCGEYVGDEKVPTAIGAFSMQFVAERAELYPEAATKLCSDLRKRMPRASPGFQNRARKVLAKLEPRE